MGLYLAPAPPERILRRMDLRNFFFRIPAGAASHEVKRCYTFERDKLLLSITPHMHYRAHDVSYELVRSDGRHETLLLVPILQFQWQLVYRLKDPLYVEKNSRLIVTAHYDNSPNNPANPDPSQSHSLGRQKRRGDDDELDRVFRRRRRSWLPRISPQVKRERASTTVNIPEDLMERVQQAAATEQRSAQELVREAVEEHLRRKRLQGLYARGEQRTRELGIPESQVDTVVRDERNQQMLGR